MSNSDWSRRRFIAGAGVPALAGAVAPFAHLAQARDVPAEGSSPRRGCSPSRPNLVLFMPDEMRADALACYGNPVTRTPNFDLLARQGARFENCNVQYPVCGASRCSLLTGWPASVRGHRSLYYFLRRDEPNMFRYLRQAGYDVYFYGHNDALAQQTFYEGDFAEWWFPGIAARAGESSQGARHPFHEPSQPSTFLLPGGFDRRSSVDYALVQRGIGVIERNEADRPFCVFLPMLMPHPPYRAPAGFDTMYKPQDLPALIPPNLPFKPSYHRAIREKYQLTRATDADLRAVRATYYGMVSFSDWLLGEVLEALDRTGRAKDTAVFVLSDHGDYAGDYGLVEKWPSGLESCLTHVPLIGRVPGATPAVVRPEMVELYDLMATCLELAGTHTTHTNFARSLVPQLHGERGDSDRAAFTEGGYNIYEPQAFEPLSEGIYGPKTHLQNEQPETVSRCAAIRTTRYTFVSRPQGQSELYDRQEDPGETRNLIASRSHEQVRHELEQRLLHWYLNTSGVPPVDRDPRDVPPFYAMPHPMRREDERKEIVDL